MRSTFIASIAMSAIFCLIISGKGYAQTTPTAPPADVAGEIQCKYSIKYNDRSQWHTPCLM